MDVMYTTLLEVCDVCGNQHPTESCPELGLDTTGLVGETKSRARLTLPDFLFEIDIAGEVGVFTRDSILQKKTQFGPFEAKKTTHEFSDEGVFILKVTTKDGTCISLDTTNENDCNWMCLIRAALTTEEQNCIAYQMGMNLYYSTTKDIVPGTELRVWYAPAYARRIGKPERPDGVSKVMLGMKVIYPSVEYLPDTEQTESYVDKETEDGSEVPSATREEVAPSYLCKRCGDCFETESCLALHLRQHIIPGYSPVTYRKHRKTFRHLTKKRGRKPKKLLLTIERKKVKSTEEIEHDTESDTVGVEESLKDEGEKEGNSDEEFTPVIISSTKIKNEGRRIQPRRSLKGIRTSGFEADENFVYVKIKTEKPDDGYGGSSSKNKEGEESIDVVPPCETPANPVKEKGEDGMEVKTPPAKRRKRGRPPKVKVTETLAVENSPQTSSNKDHVGRQESLPEETDADKEKAVTVENEAVNKDTILNSEKDERCDPDEKNDQNTTNTAEITNIRNIAQAKDDIKSCLSPTKDENENQSCHTGSGEHVDTTALSKNEQEIKIGIHENGGPSYEDNDLSTHTETMEASSVIKTQSSGETTMVETSSDLIEPVEEHTDDTDSNGNLVSGHVGDSSASASNTDGIHVPTVESIANMTVDDDLQNILDELDKTDRNVQSNSPSLSKESDLSVKKKEILTRSELTETLTQQEKEVAADKDTQTPPDVDEEKSTDDKEEESIVPFIQPGDEPEGEQSDPSTMPFHDYVVKLVKSTDELEENASNDEASKLLSTDKMIVEVDSKEDYVKYMEVEDTEDGKHYICTLCDKKFLHEKYLRLHFPVHTGKFKCKKCGAKFCRNDTLKRHQCIYSTKGTNSQKESMLATCDICNQQFANEKYLFRHYAIHTNIFQCLKCHKSFSRKDSLQRHILKCCPEEAENYSVFFCRKCQKTFATKLGRDNHETHCKQKMCDLCHSVFSSEILFSAHTCQFRYESSRNNSVKYNCSHCPKSFSNLNYLKQHLQLHEGGYICELCGRKLKTKEEKDEHEMMCTASSVIQSEGKTACPTCDLSFSDIKLYREHYHSHTHPHQCSKCLKRFVKIGSLHSHVCSIEEDRNMLFSCTICNKDFRNERMLMRHKEIHQDHKIQCQHCSKKFYRKDCYLKHVCKEADGSEMDVGRNAELRAQQEKLVCHICGKNFVSSSNLNKHMKVHGEKTCVCHICNKKFHYFEYLRVHLDGFHNKKHQFQCSECGKILTSKPGLTSHMRQFHSDEKETHACPTCGKVFSQKGNMKTHMYSHTKERGFQCTFCTKAFKYPDQLNRHKLIHTMQNKLQCDHCDKKFTKLYDLKKHFELFHSGMMYVCDVCGARTGHRHTMVRHYKRKHPETAEQAKEPSYLDSLFKHVDKEPVVTNEEIIEDQLTDGMQVNNVSNLICAEEFVPQSAAEVLQSLSNTAVGGDQPIIVADGATVIQNPDGTISMPGQEGTFSIQNIQQTVEGPDGQSTVVILQFVSQQDQEGVTQQQEVQVQESDTQVITTGAVQGPSEEVEAYVQSYVVSGDHLQETV
ncbi:uncharacterized protein LOC117316192 [Pecten maximus]|uniref:uncharacterized protein LOC117316192 n=1 Tax=Pecten maximus TaxID=6579 RepID=UPI001458E0AE|nr:uncharacterized protein LOC117316192 [Pecten maximus]